MLSVQLAYPSSFITFRIYASVIVIRSVLNLKIVNGNFSSSGDIQEISLALIITSSRKIVNFFALLRFTFYFSLHRVKVTRRRSPVLPQIAEKEQKRLRENAFKSIYRSMI